MILIEIYVVIVVIIVLLVILAILGYSSSKLNNTVLVLFLTVIAMCVGIVFVKLGMFLHTLYLMY